MMTIMFTRAQHLLYEASGCAASGDGLRERQSGVPSAEHEHRLSGDDFGDPQTNCVAEIRADSPIARAVADLAGGVLRDDLGAVSGGDAAGHPSAQRPYAAPGEG